MLRTYLPGRVAPARTSRTSRRDATGAWLPGSARTDLQGWLPLPDPWIAGARHIHWRSSARWEVSIRLCATITWAYPGIVCEKIGQAQSQVELSLCPCRRLRTKLRQARGRGSTVFS